MKLTTLFITEFPKFGQKPSLCLAKLKAKKLRLENTLTLNTDTLVPGVTYPGAAALMKAPRARAALPLPLAT